MVTTEPHPRASKAVIVSTLRRQIVTGERASGSRLPNRRDLVRYFQASSVTIQRAMDRLIRDGFIYTNGANGTFVTPYPPHLCRYGLLLFSNPGDGEKWRRFSTVLCDAAANLPSSPRRTIAVYYDINGDLNAKDYQRLVRDLRSQRLAGLIIGGSPAKLFGTPVMDTADVPRVALMEEPGGPGTPAVGHDRHAFIDQALDYFQRRGRRKIAIFMGETPFALRDYFHSALAARGMIHHPYWSQGVFVGHPELTRNIIHLMMHGNESDRPDGLMIYDDNLIEHAIAGLLDANVSSPRDVEIVAQGNFPWAMPSVMPIKRIGYDAGLTLETCMDLIERQRAGEAVPLMTLIAAMDERAAAATAEKKNASLTLTLA